MPANATAEPQDVARRPPSGREAFAAFWPVTTRWLDNDAFGHVNNAVYYSLFDTAVTGWLMERSLIGLSTGPMWVVAESGCRYFAETSFPDAISIGMRIEKIGRSSVRYHLAVFRADGAAAAAEGHFVHVHVDRESRRPLPIPDPTRGVLAALHR